MKAIKILSLALSLAILGACSESFLDSDPLTERTDVNFYKTTGDAWTALVGCYDGLQRVWGGGISFPVASEVFSDNCFGGTGAGDGYGYQMIDEFDKDRSASDRNLFENNWSDYYAAIFRVNMLLSKMDQIDWGGDEALRQRYESEAKFIRGFLYFDLVRLFGNIPLLEVPTKDNIPQADPHDVYKLIADDLKFAADNLTGISYSAMPVADHGRVTKWAAEALLARVYLYYTGYYERPDLVGVVTSQQALAYLEDVITNSGHSLVGDFADLWPAAAPEGYAGEDNKETIFAIKYTYTSDYDDNASDNIPAPLDGNHWLVMNGLREQSSFPYGNGWGGATVNPKLWNAYAANDTRKTASIISIEDEDIDFQKVDKQREYTGYYIKKYTPMCDEAGNSLAVKLGGVNFMIGQYQDFVSIRYSDVLLMAAELGSTNAQTYFDEVRRRAYGAAFTQVPVSQSAIMNERRLEFAFEGIRYWDLLRQGLDVAAQAINETGVTVLNAGNPETKTIVFNTTTKGLQQIPYNQITLSDNVLKQNPGW